MPTPRRELVDNESAGFYHCTNRCVRRAYLCGEDSESGRNYEHRKIWLTKRMRDLCQWFSIEIYAYAIMDNHYHIVLYLDPRQPISLSDEQVAENWLNVYPGKLNHPDFRKQREQRKRAIMHDDELLAKYRERLGSLSWFMSALNEPLARLSNAEDDCTGRFWQGRFTSQALLDEAAVMSCMAYVDLNPVRARITDKLEESKHTSIYQRLEAVQEHSADSFSKLQKPINAINSQISSRKLGITLKEYIELVEWAGKTIIHPDKAAIPTNIEPVLSRLNLQANHWLKQIEGYGRNYHNVVGPVEKIRALARKLKKRYLRGVGAARVMYQN